MSPAVRGRVALFCAIFSLAGGTGIFLLWTMTRWSRLEEIGFLWLGGGTLMVLAGLGFLVAARTGPDGISGRRTLLTLALLIANFPTAAAIATMAEQLKHPWIEVDVTDATRSESLHVDSVDPSPNSIEIRVSGSLDGQAGVALGPELRSPGEFVRIGPGRFERLVYGGDYYGDRATILYQPGDVRGGHVRIRCRFR